MKYFWASNKPGTGFGLQTLCFLRWTLSWLKVTPPSVFGSVQECGLTTACYTHPVSCDKGLGGNSPKIPRMVRSWGCCRLLQRLGNTLVWEPTCGSHRALCKRALWVWGDGCRFLTRVLEPLCTGTMWLWKGGWLELSIGDWEKWGPLYSVMSSSFHKCPCIFFIFP